MLLADSTQARLITAERRLDAVTEQAGRDAVTTQVLLDLSMALAEVDGVEEIATRLARSVPELVDCDRAAIVIFDPGSDRGRIVASHGYGDDAEQFLGSVEFSVLPREREAGEDLIGGWSG
jgi:hypothetical protein